MKRGVNCTDGRLTPKAALEIVLHQRKVRDAWRAKNRDKMRAYTKAYEKKLRDGYAAAKKAGLVE